MMHVAWWTRPPLCSLMLCCDLMIDTGKEAFYENEMPKMHSLVLPYFDHGRWTYALFQILKFNFSESILILVSLYINYCIFCRTVNKWNLNNIYRGCVLEANWPVAALATLGPVGVMYTRVALPRTYGLVHATPTYYPGTHLLSPFAFYSFALFT